MESALISGIAFNRDEAKLTITGVPDLPGIAYKILGPIADANIEVDMIVKISPTMRQRISLSQFIVTIFNGQKRF